MGKTVAAVVGIVASVAIAIAAPYLAPIALGALGITATSTAVAVATALIATTLSIGIAFGMRALGVGVPSALRGAVGPPTVFRQSVANSFIVYGRRRVGGLLVFFHGKQGDTGAHLRYFVIACAGHRCSGLVSFMLNDEVVTVDGSGMVTSGQYANNAWLWFQRGLSSETANATFVAECEGKWTSAHKGNGVAAIYAKFKLEDSALDAGMPNITAIIDGKDDILDTRTSTSGFTANAALVFYDWMKIPREEGGFGAYTDEIPDNTWISAQANVCDETVSGGARYKLNGVITTGAPPGEVRDVMIVNCAGSYTFSGGKHLMRPGYWVASTNTLSEDDLSGAIQVSPFMPSDAAANEVQGTYISPDDHYQAAPFTTQTISASDVRQMDLDLGLTTDKNQADRVARIMLNRAQFEKTVIWPMNISGLKVRALDTVQLASTRYGLDNYAWSVVNWSLSPDWGVVLSLREEDASVYGAPSVVAPPSPPTVAKPPPVKTLAEIQSILRSTYARNLTATASDNGASAKIALSSFIMDYPSTGDVTVAAGNITGLAFSTLYYLYVDVDAIGDTTPTRGATTVFGQAINSTAHPYRVYLNMSVTTPADGGVDTSGGGTGGGYGGGSGEYPSY